MTNVCNMNNITNLSQSLIIAFYYFLDRHIMSTFCDTRFYSININKRVNS